VALRGALARLAVPPRGGLDVGLHDPPAGPRALEARQLDAEVARHAPRHRRSLHALAGAVRRRAVAALGARGLGALLALGDGLLRIAVRLGLFPAAALLLGLLLLGPTPGLPRRLLAGVADARDHLADRQRLPLTRDVLSRRPPAVGLVSLVPLPPPPPAARLPPLPPPPLPPSPAGAPPPPPRAAQAALGAGGARAWAIALPSPRLSDSMEEGTI